ncbi:putative DUF1835 domain-containing protein [Gammaproteobacteria bacterium]
MYMPLLVVHVAMKIHIAMHESVRLFVEKLVRTNDSEDVALIIKDMLSFGPLALKINSDWILARSNYWRKTMGLVSLDQVTSAYQNFFLAESSLLFAKEIFIWAGQTLDEQLFVAWSIFSLNQLGVDMKNVRCMVITKDASTSRFIESISMLSWEGFKKTLEADGQSIDIAEYDDILLLWSGITASAPSYLLECKYGRTKLTSMMFDRVRLIKYRYPAIDSGLNKIDYSLLKLCNKFGPSPILIVVEYAANAENEDKIGDARILKLSAPNLEYPLLELEGDISKLRTFTVKLTEAGLAVLAGEVNFIKLNGIDDWVGGVHLNSHSGPIWCYDSEKDGLLSVNL